MPRRYWEQGRAALAGAFVALVIGSGLIGIYNAGRLRGETVGEHIANTDTYAHQAQQEIANRCLDSEAVDVAQCIQDVIEATNEHERAESDLIAQEDMALWALEMFVVSLLGTGLAAAGTVLIYRSFKQTRAALAIGQEANTIAIKAAELDARPWLHVEIGAIRSPDIGPSNTADGTPMVFSAIVDVTIKNTGKTPARNVFIHVAACDEKGAMAMLDFAYEATPGDSFYLVGAIAPGADASQDFPISLALNAAPTDRYFIFGSRLMCIIRYADAISGNRTSPLRTIQHFIIENRIEDGAGHRRTMGLGRHSIESGAANLAVRPAMGEMT